MGEGYPKNIIHELQELRRKVHGSHVTALYHGYFPDMLQSFSVIQ